MQNKKGLQKFVHQTSEFGQKAVKKDWLFKSQRYP